MPRNRRAGNKEQQKGSALDPYISSEDILQFPDPLEPTECVQRLQGRQAKLHGGTHLFGVAMHSEQFAQFHDTDLVDHFDYEPGHGRPQS